MSKPDQGTPRPEEAASLAQALSSAELERRINKIETRQDGLDEKIGERTATASEIERRIDKLEARHEQSEKNLLDRHTKQITIIFSCMSGFIAVCAILVTALGWLSRNESREAAKDLKSEVDKSLANIEARFQKLSGDLPRRPKVEILTRVGMLDGQLKEVPPAGLAEWGALFIKNSGDRKTEPLSIRLFSTRPLVPPTCGIWSDVPSLDKDYPRSYFLSGMGQIWIEAKETWVVCDPFSIGVGGETNIACKLEVYYGVEEPAEAKFQLTLKK